MVHLDCGRGIISISKTVMSGYHGIRDNGRGSYSWPSLIDRMQEKEGCFLSANQHCYLLFFFRWRSYRMMHAISSYRQLFRSVCDSCFHRLQQQQQQQRRRPAQLGRTFFSSASVRHAWRLKIDSPAARANPQLYYVPKDQYIASQCVSKLLERATVQDALEYLTALRVDLQSTAAWNLILKALAREGKANQADKCFVQVNVDRSIGRRELFSVCLTD